jgi:exonuclease III
MEIREELDFFKTEHEENQPISRETGKETVENQNQETAASPRTGKRKKTRRGQRIRNKMKKFTIWYQNIRGIKSKLESLREKIEEYSPTVVCITETHLLDTEPMSLEGYKIFRNDRDSMGGGSLIAVSEAIDSICTEVDKEKEGGETFWLTIDNTRIKIRLGVIYAPQESRNKIPVYKKLYKRIENQIEEAKERAQKLLILGDFNCKVGEAIKNNKSEISKSGKLLTKMIEKENLCLINSLDVCDGLWTRVEGECRSVLDYVLMRNEDEAAVKYMKIDEDREHSPLGYENGQCTCSDHNVITMEIDWCMLEKNKPKEESKILTKKGERNCQLEMQQKEVSKILDKKGDFEDVYREWKIEVSNIVEKNKIQVKNFNPRRAIRNLIKEKKRLKKRQKTAQKRIEKQSLLPSDKLGATSKVNASLSLKTKLVKLLIS